MGLWTKWVEDRRETWSHVHVSALLVWHNEAWACLSSNLVLLDGKDYRVPTGVTLLWPKTVCNFRVAVELERLQDLIEGLRLGVWKAGLIPDISDPIRMGPQVTPELVPVSDPRLETASSGDVARPEDRWPRYSFELQLPSLKDWVGESARPAYVNLDGRLTGKGKLNLALQATQFGSLSNISGQFADIWDRQSSVRLVAPALCRIESTEVKRGTSNLVASVRVGKLVPRSRAALVVHDLSGVGVLDPVLLPDVGESPVEVVLTSDRVSSQAEVKLLFFDQDIQTERGRFNMSIASAAEMVGGSVTADRETYGGWKPTSEVPLGTGGQASVRIAQRNSEVGALKIVHDDRADPRRLTRLRREIGFLRRFQETPFLIRLLDASPEEAEVPFLVTEYAQLGNVDENVGFFAANPYRTLRLARDVAVALWGLHAEDVIHRDVKPKNIFLFTPDHVALADLGVAYDMSLTSQTTTEELVYSGWFSPPESKVLGSPRPAFDVFMLGQTIYYLISGGKKYRRKGVATPDFSVDRYVFTPSAGSAVTSLLARMVVDDPHDRIQSMRELVEAIDETMGSIFGPKPGMCAKCGSAALQQVGPVQLSNASLGVPWEGRQVQLEQNRLVLFVCPKCGTCLFQLDESARAELFRSRVPSVS
jgi:hypothetical protein